jgi:hypothetical protein
MLSRRECICVVNWKRKYSHFESRADDHSPERWDFEFRKYAQQSLRHASLIDRLVALARSPDRIQIDAKRIPNGKLPAPLKPALRNGFAGSLHFLPARLLAANRLLAPGYFPHQRGEAAQQAGFLHGIMSGRPRRHAARALDGAIGFYVPMGFEVGFPFPQTTLPRILRLPIVPRRSFRCGCDAEGTGVLAGCLFGRTSDCKRSCARGPEISCTHLKSCLGRAAP